MDDLRLPAKKIDEPISTAPQWIPLSGPGSRLPTEADANELGRVNYACPFYDAPQQDDWRNPEGASHFCPIPKAPPLPKPVENTQDQKDEEAAVKNAYKAAPEAAKISSKTSAGDWMRGLALELNDKGFINRDLLPYIEAIIAKHASADRAELAALRAQREQEESGDGNSPLMLVHRDAFSKMQAEKQSSHNRSERYRISNLDYIARAETAEQQNKALRLSSQSLRDALEGAKAAITNLGEELAKIASAGLDNFENTLSQEDGHRFGAIANTANFARTLYGSPALKAITAALSATARTEGEA